jgi:hypothetical protein
MSPVPSSTLTRPGPLTTRHAAPSARTVHIRPGEAARISAKASVQVATLYARKILSSSSMPSTARSAGTGATA